MYGLMNLQAAAKKVGEKIKESLFEELQRRAEMNLLHLWQEHLNSGEILCWFNLFNYPIIYFKNKGSVLQLEV